MTEERARSPARDPTTPGGGVVIDRPRNLAIDDKTATD